MKRQTTRGQWRTPFVTAPCMVGALIASVVPAVTAPTLVSYALQTAMYLRMKTPPALPRPSWGGELSNSAIQTVWVFGLPTGIFVYPLSAMVCFALTAVAAGSVNRLGVIRRWLFLSIGVAIGIVAHGGILLLVSPLLPEPETAATIVVGGAVTGLATAAILWPFRRRARLQHVVRCGYLAPPKMPSPAISSAT